MITAKETIMNTFLKLLSVKSLDELTVKEIVHQASISRSTFYLYFTDKYELMEEVRILLNNKFLSYYQQEPSNKLEPITLYICKHIFKFRSFYEVEFADASSIRKLSNNLADYLYKVFDDYDYAIFASYGTIGYLSIWVKDGFVISPGEAAEKLLKIGFTDWTKVINQKSEITKAKG